MQLPKNVFFDMDDTILVYEGVSQKSWEQAFAGFAHLVDDLDAHKLLISVNEARVWYWSDPERDRRGRLDLPTARRELVSLAFSQLGIDAGSVADEIADAYTVIKEEAVEVFPGAIETLRYLRDMGKRLALITNGTSLFQRAKIDRFGLEPLFDYILIEGEFGVGKPDQRVFRHALEQLDTRPSEAMMVGDNLTADIAGAQALGIRGVWVDWSGDGLPEDSLTTPDWTVRAISDLVR